MVFAPSDWFNISLDWWEIERTNTIRVPNLATLTANYALFAENWIRDSSGKVTAAEVAQMVFDAVAEGRFYIYSHPKAIASVQTRMEDVMLARNPTDPFAHKPHLGEELKRLLR